MTAAQFELIGATAAEQLLRARFELLSGVARSVKRSASPLTSRSTSSTPSRSCAAAPPTSSFRFSRSAPTPALESRGGARLQVTGS